MTKPLSQSPEAQGEDCAPVLGWSWSPVWPSRPISCTRGPTIPFVMRTLRPFHRDQTCSQGQLVIAMEEGENQVSCAPETSGKAETQGIRIGRSLFQHGPPGALGGLWLSLCSRRRPEPTVAMFLKAHKVKKKKKPRRWSAGGQKGLASSGQPPESLKADDQGRMPMAD